VSAGAIAAARLAKRGDEQKDTAVAKPVVIIDRLDAYFGTHHAVKGVSVAFNDRQVTAIIGPSGCGKSTFLRCLNRMHETVPSARMEGTMSFDGMPIYGPGTTDAPALSGKERTR